MNVCPDLSECIDCLDCEANTMSTYTDIIAKELRADGWSYGQLAYVDERGELMHVVDAHKNGEKCIARAETQLTAYMEVQKLAAKVSFDTTSPEGPRRE